MIYSILHSLLEFLDDSDGDVQFTVTNNNNNVGPLLNRNTSIVAYSQSSDEQSNVQNKSENKTLSDMSSDISNDIEMKDSDDSINQNLDVNSQTNYDDTWAWSEAGQIEMHIKLFKER